MLGCMFVMFCVGDSTSSDQHVWLELHIWRSLVAVKHSSYRKNNTHQRQGQRGRGLGRREGERGLARGRGVERERERERDRATGRQGQ